MRTGVKLIIYLFLEINIQGEPDKKILLYNKQKRFFRLSMLSRLDVLFLAFNLSIIL